MHGIESWRWEKYEEKENELRALKNVWNSEIALFLTMDGGWMDGGKMGGRGGEFGPPSECEDAGSDVEKR